MVGQTISHYRIVGQLGAGGMGVLYSAEHTLLGRSVAIKFVSAELAGDRHAVERLRVEARAASALNHANICTIHDFGDHEGRPFIVMELMKGQTLRERLLSGPLKIAQIVDMGIHIADALDAAHSQGIVHRDIKPANLFLTDRGQVKILDFGLAKLLPQHGALETTETPVTARGAAVGTVWYMSPEQATGEELDGRSDVFSFGIVLYECVTGHPPFTGRTAAVVHSAILNRAPTPPIVFNPEMPLRLMEVIRLNGSCALTVGLAAIRHTSTSSGFTMAPPGSHLSSDVAAPVGKLATLFTDLYGPRGLIVDSLATLPGEQPHSAHFNSDFQFNFSQFSTALVSQLVTVPLPSPASGFTFRFDPSLGVFQRSTQSFGPILAERAETVGAGRVSFGSAFQRFTFDTIEALDLRRVPAVFTHDNAQLLGGREDVVTTLNSIEATVSQLTVFFTVGVTDRFDVSVAVPVVANDVKVVSDATIQRLGTINPLTHFYRLSDGDVGTGASSRPSEERAVLVTSPCA